MVKAAPTLYGSQQNVPSTSQAGTPKPVAATAAPGVSPTPAADDHVHAMTSGIVTLDNLSDVTITTPATAQVIRYNGATWVNAALLLDDLSDVVITSAAANHILKHNGTNWVNDNAAYGAYTPTVTQTSTRAGTTNQGSFQKVGRNVKGSVRWTSTVAGSAAALIFNYPGGFTPVDTTFGVVGSGYINDTAAGGAKPLVSVVASAAGFQFATDGATVYGVALAIGTVVVFRFDFEATT